MNKAIMPKGFLESPFAVSPKEFSGSLMRKLLVSKERHRTVELTRRREFIQASPDQLSYETRSRRSRPTICSVASNSKTPVIKRDRDDAYISNVQVRSRFHSRVY